MASSSIEDICEVTPDDIIAINEFVKEVIELIETTDICEQINDMAAYPKFDPKIIRNQIITYQPDEKRRKKELVMMVYLGLTGDKRNHWDSDATLLNLVKVYHLEIKAGQFLGQHTITLSRILNAFPEIAYQFLLKRPQTRRPVSTAYMNSLGYPEFPSELRGQFALYLIPHSLVDDYQYIIKAVLAYMVEEHKILNQRTKGRMSQEERLKTILFYALAAYKSCLLPDQSKVEFLKAKKDANAVAWGKKFDETFPSHTKCHQQFK